MASRMGTVALWKVSHTGGQILCSVVWKDPPQEEHAVRLGMWGGCRGDRDLGGSCQAPLRQGAQGNAGALLWAEHRLVAEGPQRTLKCLLVAMGHCTATETQAFADLCHNTTGEPSG